MKLYYMPGACPLASHILLQWAGADYELQKVEHDALKTSPFIDLNPMGAVPVLEVDGHIITQNNGVMSYIISAFPEAKLGGDGSALSAAEVHRWLGFVNSDMHPAFKPIFGATAYLGDEAMVEKSKANAKAVLRKQFAILDAQLKGKDWIAGHRSVADSYLYVMIRWAHGVGVDLSGLSEVARFYDRMNQDAGVLAALAAEGLSVAA